MPPPDVLILGAGVIGCAVARDLAARGLEVLVLEGGRPGAGASWAAAGMLSPHLVAPAEAGRRTILECARWSLGEYPSLVEALRQETGIDVEVGGEGILDVARDEAGEGAVRTRLHERVAAGLAGSWLGEEDTRRLEPGLGGSIRGAGWYPGDDHLDNRRLVRALETAAVQAGARIESGRPVSSLWIDRSGLRGAVAGGDRVGSSWVVVAAGAGSGGLVPDGRSPLPIEPVRGQMIGLEVGVPAVHRPVLSEAGYVVPRRDGRVLAGTTLEPGERVPEPTAEGVARIAAAAVSLIPALSTGTFRTAWAGLRPCTPDGVPLLGADPEFPSLLYATGHGPNGILLAPLTAEWIACSVEGRPAPLDPDPLLPSRFWSVTGGPVSTGSSTRPVA